MDVTIRAFIHSFCSVFFPDDICSLNFMPNKIKLIRAILLIPLILTILYRKIISNHDHFEHFRNNKKNKCCRRIPIIVNNNYDKTINIPNIDIWQEKYRNIFGKYYSESLYSSPKVVEINW